MKEREEEEEIKRKRQSSSQSLSEFAKLRDCAAAAMAIGVFKQTSADAAVQIPGGNKSHVWSRFYFTLIS